MIVLHRPCHNPTGQDLDADSLLTIVQSAGERGVVPLIDATYHGFGNDLGKDLAQLSKLLTLALECVLILAGSKAFGLYRDRIGALFSKCADAKIALRVRANAENWHG